MNYFDFHCHPSFKPYHNSLNEEVNLWDFFPEKTSNLYEMPALIRGSVRKFGFEGSSQSNLQNLLDGGVKGVVLAIHPIEKGWFMNLDKKFPLPPPVFINLFDDYPFIFSFLTGASITKSKKLIEETIKENPENINYFKEALEEYKIIKSEEKKNNEEMDRSFKIVKDFEDYQNNQSTMLGILSIEGGHTLLSDVSKDELLVKFEDLPTSRRDDIKKQVLENILKLKGESQRVSEDEQFSKDKVPFYMTIAHFYNNLLCGHAKSYPDKSFLGIIKKLFDQGVYLNEGINDLGEEVIDFLLDRRNGRRVLIDIKHMSAKARLRYYEMIKEKKEKIPIICSHGAANGMPKTVDTTDNSSFEKENSYFSRWSINLSNEDFIEIIKSDGIFGLVIHEGRMPGKNLVDFLAQKKKRLRRFIKRMEKCLDRLRTELRSSSPNNDIIEILQKDILLIREKMKPLNDELKKEYCRLILSHIFHFVKVAHKENLNGWEFLCLGTDFDGIMNPLDAYNKSDDFPTLFNDLKLYLEMPIKLGDVESLNLGLQDGFLVTYDSDGTMVAMNAKQMKHLMGNKTPKTLLEGIFSNNAENFLKKYFNDEFLGKIEVHEIKENSLSD